MNSRARAAWKKIQALSMREFVRMICEATVDPPRVSFALSAKEKSRISRNPFATLIAEEMYMPRACGTHLDLAAITLSNCKDPMKNSFNCDSVGRGLAREEGFIAIKDFISRATNYPFADSMPEWLYSSMDIETLFFFFYVRIQPVFDDALYMACSLIYHGMPIFRHVSGDAYEMLPFDDAEYVYLAKKGEYDEAHGAAHDAAGRYPRWSECNYFRRSDFQVHERFFGKPGEYYFPEQVIQLRAALRHSLGLEADPSLSEKLSESKGFPLVPLLNQVLNRECDGLFQEAGSWPKQEVVSAWLKSRKNLSKRQADAIALIATRAKAK